MMIFFRISITHTCYLPIIDSGCYIFVYDATDTLSLMKTQMLLYGVENAKKPCLSFLLLGNKSDLPNKSIKTEDARIFARKNNMLFYEVSDRTGHNVKFAFEQVIRLARRKELKPELNAITQQRRKIDSLISICHYQSRSINQLKELFNALRKDVNNKFNSLVNIINENDIF